MNMKRIVFIGVAILLMLIIIAWMLHSIAHVDEINQQRREKDRGEALASRMITTTVTTSVWDALRQKETESSSESYPENSEMVNPEESEFNPEETLSEDEEQEQFTEELLSEETASIPQTVTEVLQ